MNAKEELEERKEKRFQFLNKLWELTDKDESGLIRIDRIGKELGFDDDLTIKIAQYLSGEGSIVVQPIHLGHRMDDLIGISHAGLVEVEAALDNPDRHTQYIPPANIIHINQMVNSTIQQDSPEAIQVVTFDESKYKELKEMILSLKESIDQLGLEPQQKSELRAEIQTMEVQTASPNPKATIITECLGSIRRILEGATGSVLASGLLSKIVALSGGS